MRLAKTFLIGYKACERDFAQRVFVKMRETPIQHTTILSAFRVCNRVAKESERVFA